MEDTYFELSMRFIPQTVEQVALAQITIRVQCRIVSFFVKVPGLTNRDDLKYLKLVGNITWHEIIAKS